MYHMYVNVSPHFMHWRMYLLFQSFIGEQTKNTIEWHHYCVDRHLINLNLFQFSVRFDRNTSMAITKNTTFIRGFEIYA